MPFGSASAHIDLTAADRPRPVPIGSAFFFSTAGNSAAAFNRFIHFLLISSDWQAPPEHEHHVIVALPRVSRHWPYFEMQLQGPPRASAECSGWLPLPQSAPRPFHFKLWFRVRPAEVISPHGE